MACVCWNSPTAGCWSISLRFREGVSAYPSFDNDHLARLRAELGFYFAGTLKVFTVPLDTPGTPFEQRVWDALRRTSYGSTVSYEGVTRMIGMRAADARAVGRANGMNRVAIIIPCHRVIMKSGNLGGYGGGLWRKQRLLDLERGEQSLFSGCTRAK